MKNSIKGALLSGLVFPGLGQIIQGRNKAGIIFIAGSVIGLSGITYAVIHKAMLVMRQIKPLIAQGQSISTHELIRTAAHIPNGIIGNTAPFIFIICWIISTIHALRFKDE